MSNPNMNPFEKFSPEAQSILTASYQLLMEMQHSQLDIEHLLLALLRQKDNSAIHVIKQLGVDTNILTSEVATKLAVKPKDTQVHEDFQVSIYVTPRMQGFFKAADEVRQNLEAATVSPAHLLLAMTANQDDETAQLLKRFNLDYSRISHALPGSRPPQMSSSLTHFNEAGRARMVDVSDKAVTDRRGVARGEVVMQAATLALVRQGRVKKGDVLAVAQIAGIMAAKKTHEIIPMCHPLLITGVDLNFELVDAEAGNAGLAVILIEASVKTSGQTGVEMEALTAVSAAALTIYDMLKAVDRSMIIQNIHLTHKSGGKSGVFEQA